MADETRVDQTRANETSERALPISANHREFTVKVGGETVPREHQLASVSISLVVNRIASAKLAYLDGSAAGGDFPLSGSTIFIPGQTVEILAGAGSDTVSLFKGVVIKQSIRLREQADPQLMIECRHVAMKLTVARQNTSYFDQSDSDIIESLLNKAKIKADVEAISFKHKQSVQFYTTDWDFILARAKANGKLIWAKDDGLVIKAPVVNSSPAVTLQFGSTLLEFDAQVDARQQFSAIEGISWDPAQQAIVKVEAAAPSIKGAGNFSEDDLAKVASVDALQLRHVGLSEPEVQAWANSEKQRSLLNKSSGRAKCEGIGTLKPGDSVMLSGVGARFNGAVFLTGVRHEYSLVQGWKTHIQFGGLEADEPAHDSMSAPAAGHLLARVAGLQIGVVVSNEDPDGEDRVRICLPMVNPNDEGIWARVASLDAGKDRGFFFRPDKGDEVIVGFLDEDPRHAVILGMLHSSAHAAPLKGSDDNHEKVFQSRSGMRLYFNDEKKIVQIDTPAGNSVTLSEEDTAIVVADQNKNTITLNKEGITIESSKALTLKAATEVKMESGTSFSAKGGTELKLEGSMQAELSSGAMTKVSGGMVQIN
ncbi:MAG: type VI secretion system tip protein VgrG [Pseudomonadota bacterium]